MLSSRLFGSRLANLALRSGISGASRPVVHKILIRRQQHTQPIKQDHGYQDQSQDYDGENNGGYLRDSERDEARNQRAVNSAKLQELFEGLQSGLKEGKSVRELHDKFIYGLNDVDISARSRFITRTTLGPIINELIDLSVKESADPNAIAITPDDILQSAVQLQVADITNFEKVMHLHFKSGKIGESLSLWVSFLEYGATIGLRATPNYLKTYTVLAYIENCASQGRVADEATLKALLQTEKISSFNHMSKVLKENINRADPRFAILSKGIESLFLQNKDPNSLKFLVDGANGAKSGNTFQIDRAYSNIFKTAELTGKKISEDTLVQFMSFYNKVGRAQTAMGFWNEIIKSGITPSTSAWNNLLSTVSALGPRQGRLQQAEAIYDQIPEKDEDTYCKMINILSGFKEFEKVDEFVDEEKLALETVAQTYAQSLLNRNETEKSLKIIEDLKKNDIPLTLVTYNSLLKSQIKNQDLKGAKKVLKEMNDAGVKPDVATYTMIIDLTFKETRLKGNLVNDDLISKMLEDMRSSGIDPNAYTMTSIIDGLGKDLAYEETGLKLFQYLQEHNMTSSVTYVAIISNLFNFGRTRQAELYFSDYVKAGFKVNNPLWNMLFEGWMKNRNSQKAYEYYQIFRESSEDALQRSNKYAFYFLFKAAKICNNDANLANSVLSDIEKYEIYDKISPQTLKVIQSLGSSNESIKIPKKLLSKGV